VSRISPNRGGGPWRPAGKQALASKGAGGARCELSPVQSPANLTEQGTDQLVPLVKTRLKRIQYRPGVIDGFLASTGLDLTHS
jgi:hypothetical protein